MVESGGIGRSLGRDDAEEKTAGRTRFSDDHPRPGLLHAAVLASPHSRARIVSIDVSRAKAASGVRGVFVGADWDALIGLYMGTSRPSRAARCATTANR
jgi:CO/xanthine dehydrogenase Mo-binding subunit